MYSQQLYSIDFIIIIGKLRETISNKPLLVFKQIESFATS